MKNMSNDETPSLAVKLPSESNAIKYVILPDNTEINDLSQAQKETLAARELRKKQLKKNKILVITKKSRRTQNSQLRIG